MEILDGNAVSSDLLNSLADRVETYGEDKPCVAFIRVGEDPASISYVRKKEKTAARIGIQSRLKTFPESISQVALLDEISLLNSDSSVHGILVQAPLPAHIDECVIFNHVNPNKDVDGFNAKNLGLLCQEDEKAFVSCTPAGIIELVKRAGVDTQGKHVVVIGRSLIVGKPVGMLFLQKKLTGNATVTYCHSRTPDLAFHTKQADILVAAIGRPNFVTKPMIKSGAIIIDVGINRIADETRKSGFRLVGDVAFNEVAPEASFITPVPGGVGPMTVAMLMSNTVKAYEQSLKKHPTQ
ncbi:MAG: bifunctional 5,10-methylene-tetrahydrofolate dehydrogenase/5,10-methylene-tetrahydrofolate cyclohydrolase [Verrucomicrobia bacterium TMED56]|nr:MAG: bifunctional 5,10-methylene-tetrahydrofolate dehydrogenase/5,10-methylene-tetrahydrofolate cyclohydrolase [Verrucomicrobia bacterium TMED56]